MPQQRYVSRELTHFVGRGRPEEDQYQLLLTVLRDGWLTAPPHDRVTGRSRMMIDYTVARTFPKLVRHFTALYARRMNIIIADIPSETIDALVRSFAALRIARSGVQAGAFPLSYGIPVATTRPCRSGTRSHSPSA
jgi:hypothetical protein